MIALAELRVNLKIRVSSTAAGDAGFVMIVHQLRGNPTHTVFAARKHSGPIGGSPNWFEFYVDGDGFKDGTGRQLIVERFQRVANG